MKYFIKYSFLFICFFYFISPGISQQKNSKKITVISSKKNKKAKKKKAVKTKSKKNSKKGSAKKKTPKLNIETADLSKLLTTTNIVTPKLDTVPEKEVNIISAFKPQLKNIAKISFTKATYKVDTTTSVLNYQVPTQNLTFQYRPISLIPRAYKENESAAPINKTNLKVGLGNNMQQLFDLSLNAVDKYNNSHALHANFESSKGLEYLQQYNRKGIAYLGDFMINEHNRLKTETFFQNSQQYRFGLVPDNNNLSLSNYSQAFSHFGTAFNWVNDQSKIKNQIATPLVKIENFKGQANTNNFWIEIYNPMSFALKNSGKINLDFVYNYNKYNGNNLAAIKNSVFSIQPSIEINKWNTSIKVGVNPTFTTSQYALYPVVQFTKKLNDTNNLLVANWQTILTNNNYATLAMTNPWIAAPSDLKITTQEKKSLDLIINASKRMQYSIGLSLNDYHNIPFFNRLNYSSYSLVSSSFMGLQYQPIFEYRAITLEFLSTFRYQFSDQLLLNAKAKYIQFNSIKNNSNPWGILPLTINSDLTWFPSKKWAIEGGMQYWSGASLLNDANQAYALKNTLVLNASFSYQLTHRLKAWGKGENLLDKKYQRWGEYPSLGVQLIAGIVYSFHK